MTGPEIAEFIKEKYNKDGRTKNYSYRSQTYKMLGVEFRTIVWKVVDRMMKMGLSDDIKKSYRSIVGVTFQSTVSIRVLIKSLDKYKYITIPLYAFIEEGVGPKTKRHLIKLRLNRLEKRQDEILIELGKVSLEIEDLRRKLQ